jgi:hypothetical protein
MFDIGVFAYLRTLFFRNNEELRIKGLLGQPPRGTSAGSAHSYAN